MSAWLKVYSVRSNDPAFDKEKLKAANEAVRHIGTNAIPALLPRLMASDSPFTLRLVALARKQHLFKVTFTSATDKYLQGYNGFRELGAKGGDTVPVLIRMYEQNLSPESQNSIAIAFGCVGPAAEEAIPMLLRSLGDAKPSSRECAIVALGGIHARPEIVLPPLIKCLSDQDVSVKWYAALAVGYFGPDAKLAVPDLLKLLSDSDARLRDQAKDSLKKIDPEAAANAGVK
ncbi:MAG: repeat protein [Pedosphaera sp.]|nr:repeat protein [Pedosphaera sp.]